MMRCGQAVSYVVVVVADAGEDQVEETKEVGGADCTVVVLGRFHCPVEQRFGNLRENPTIVDRPKCQWS